MVVTAVIVFIVTSLVWGIAMFFCLGWREDEMNAKWRRECVDREVGYWYVWKDGSTTFKWNENDDILSDS